MPDERLQGSLGVCDSDTYQNFNLEASENGLVL